MNTLEILEKLASEFSKDAEAYKKQSDEMRQCGDVPQVTIGLSSAFRLAAHAVRREIAKVKKEQT